MICLLFPVLVFSIVALFGKSDERGNLVFIGIVTCKTELVEKYMELWSWKTFFFGVGVYVIAYMVQWCFVMTVGGIVLSYGLALLADKNLPMIFCGFRNYTYQIFLMVIFAQIAVKYYTGI